MTKPSIGLLGHDGAGKTTIADYLVAEHGYRKLSFAEPLRELAMLNGTYAECVRRHGYRGTKDRYPMMRQYLIDLGDGIRKYDPVYFVKALAQQITDMDPDRPWVIDDVRKQQEVNFLHDMGFRFAYVNRGERLASEIDLAIPTKVITINNNGAQWMTKAHVTNLLTKAEWALGTEVKADDPAGGAPVLERQSPDQAGEGVPADGDGASPPHWCARCEGEFKRDWNLATPANLEARSRWYADESRRHSDEGSGLGATPAVCNGQGDALCDHPARCGGVVLNPSGWPGDVRPDRERRRPHVGMSDSFNDRDLEPED